MSVQKQTLRENNRALAENLAKVRQELHQAKLDNQKLSLQSQQDILELNRLRRLVGLKDDEIEIELHSRMEQHKQEMCALLQDLTTSMVQSTKYITILHDKCQPTTDSTRSRSSSLAAADVEKRNPMTKQFLSMADEFAAGASTKRVATVLGMSIIAEQSMLDDNAGLYNPLALSSVKEIMFESSPRIDVASKPLSKLPLRVLRHSRGLITSASSTCNEDSDTNNYNKTAAMTKVGLAKDKQQTIEEIPQCQSENGKKEIHDEEQTKIVESVNLDTSDCHALKDVNAFGFGGNFAAKLILGSPIVNPENNSTSHSKQQDSLIFKSSNCSNDSSNEKTAKKRTVIILKQSQQVNEKKQENGQTKLTTTSDINPKLPVTGNLSKSKSDSHLSSRKSKSPVNETCKTMSHVKQCLSRQKSDLHISNVQSKSKENAKEANNSKSFATLRSPEKLEQGEVYNQIKDPFKPTKTLVHSPLTKTGAVLDAKQDKANPVTKVNSFVYLNKIGRVLDGEVITSEPLPQPLLLDEPTAYFSTEMDFTSVIASSKFAASMNSCENHSQRTIEGHKTNQGIFKNADVTVKAIDSENINDQIMEDFAVEGRSSKPGAFTFNVSQKEADGIRKPIPENVSKTKSKKKKKVSIPEINKMKNADERDTFNFGDRTQTVPLEKLVITYAPSLPNPTICESGPLPVNALKNKQKNIEDTNYSEKIEPKQNDGSPDNKPIARSHKKNSDEDENWVPGGKTKSKSQTRCYGKSRSKTAKSFCKVLDEKEVKRNEMHCFETKWNGFFQSAFADGKGSVEEENNKNVDVNKYSVQEHGSSVDIGKNYSELEIMDLKCNEFIYNLPIVKGTPEYKHVTSRARSKPGTRSNARNQTDNIDSFPSDSTISKSEVFSQARSRSREVEFVSEPESVTMFGATKNVSSSDNKEKDSIDCVKKLKVESNPRSRRRKGSVTNETEHLENNEVMCPNLSTSKNENDTECGEIIGIMHSKDKPQKCVTVCISKSKANSCTKSSKDMEITTEMIMKPDENDHCVMKKKLTQMQSTNIEMVEAIDSDIENQECLQNVESINKLKKKDKSANVLNSESAENSDHCYTKEHEKMLNMPIKPKDLLDAVGHSQLDVVSTRRGRLSKHLISADVNLDGNDTKDKSDKLNDNWFVTSKHLPGIKAETDTEINSPKDKQNVLKKAKLIKKCSKSVQEKIDVAVTKEKTNRDIMERLGINQKTQKSDVKRRLPSDGKTSQPVRASNKVGCTKTSTCSHKCVANTQPDLECSPKVQVKEATENQPVAECKLWVNVETKEDCDNPDDFAILMKHTATLDGESKDSQLPRKPHLTETSSINAEEYLSDGADGAAGKRSRRAKAGVNYVLKPLNVKLRQGDKMFDSPPAKAETEHARLAIAMKMAVSRHIKEYEENVGHTVQV